MKKHRTISILLALTMILTFMPAISFADSPLKANAAGGLNVSKHTQQEIINYINASGVSVSDPVEFDVQPVKNTERGKLSRKSHNGAVAMLNNVRYVAGLDPVSGDDGYESLAQAAAFVNMSIGKMTHYPADSASKPEAMSDADWNDGCLGARCSNLYSGGGRLNYYALWWTGDSDSGNIDRVGHRRWCLNPSMGKTGYGYANGYAAMYSFDRSGSGSQSNVAWPAENMPIEYFGSNIPWSVSTGRRVDKSSVSIKLTRRSDGKEWTFSGTDSYSPSNSKYFNVNNDGYGETGCIIFRPDGISSYNDGDVFDVSISENGTETISYTVNFFNLNKQEPGGGDEPGGDQPHTHSLIRVPAKEAKCETDGNIEYWYCDDCGKYYKDANAAQEISRSATVIAKTGHKWDNGVEKDGKTTYTCTVCGKTKTEEASGGSLEDFYDTVYDLPYYEYITLDDEEAVKEARALYDALSEKQKNECDEDAYVMLEDAEQAISLIKEFNREKAEAKGKTVSGLKMKSLKGRKVKVSWTAADDVSGYQVQYSTSKSFKKKSSKKVGATKLTVKNLKANKTYYFRVRTYKTVYNDLTDEPTKCYGKWSKVKSCKVKK